MAARKKKGNFTLFKIIFVIITIMVIGGFLGGFKFYNTLFQANVNLGDKETDYVCIPTGSEFDSVLNILCEKEIIINCHTFEWVAKLKNYPDNIKPGRYKIIDEMSNNELINLLRSGRQEPVRLIFNNIRTREQLAGRISRQIEADSTEIMNLLNNNPYLENFGLNSDNILVLFLPNTYEFYWNTSAEKFMERMHREYKSFWTEERLDKAAAAGLSPVEVSVLASIVQAETRKKDEMARVAGVYINRLNKNMLLQADPTVVYAWGDFELKRVVGRHLQIDSPYNTYKYAGLPPGPINLPELHTLDYVLNYEHHDFLYFCAKEDFSGYHAFAKTHQQHSANAQRYRRALNRRGVR
ncbi:MAG: endolytic transglycosylase MltG [Bacteroidales bacterium]|nr:endolytic transglycosylase MltG [Bacteroidales bacterium]